MRAACLGRCAPGGARKDPDPLGAGGTYAALRRLIGRTAVVGRRGCRRRHAVAFWMVLSRRSGESWAHPSQGSPTRRSGGMSIASPPTTRPDRTRPAHLLENRKSTRLNSSHITISYDVFCLKKKK